VTHDELERKKSTSVPGRADTVRPRWPCRTATVRASLRSGT